MEHRPRHPRQLKMSPELWELSEKIPPRKFAPYVCWALSKYLRSAHVLYVVTLESTGAQYYGHCLQTEFDRHDDYLVALLNTDTAICPELELHGISEFTLREVGRFERFSELHHYLCFVLNDRTDRGIRLYNDELVTRRMPRYIRFGLDYTVARRFSKFCVSKGSKIHLVVQRIILKYITSIEGSHL